MYNTLARRFTTPFFILILKRHLPGPVSFYCPSVLASDAYRETDSRALRTQLVDHTYASQARVNSRFILAQ